MWCYKTHDLLIKTGSIYMKLSITEKGNQLIQVTA
jgi:hypothetical protein